MPPDANSQQRAGRGSWAASSLVAGLRSSIFRLRPLEEPLSPLRLPCRALSKGAVPPAIRRLTLGVLAARSWRLIRSALAIGRKWTSE